MSDITRTKVTKFTIITVCGSMRYFARMIKVAEQYTTNGYIVLMPYVANYSGGMKSDNLKDMLDKMHMAKIDLSYAIIVVGEHIGESTTREIEYARKTGKKIIYV